MKNTVKFNSRFIASLTPKSKPYEVKDSEVRGLGVRVQPSGSMSYFVPYRRLGGEGKTRKTIGNARLLTVAQARDEAIIFLSEVARGIDPVIKDRQNQKMLLKNFIDVRYEPWIVSHNRGGASTINMLRFAFKDLLSRNLKEVTPWVIESWKAQNLKSGLKPSTVNRYLNALRACLARAVEWGVIENHPFRGIKKCKENQTPRVRYLSVDEEARLRTAMNQRECGRRSERTSANEWRAHRGYALFPDYQYDEFTDHLEPMVLLSLNLGLRRGELFSLRWDDLNFDRRSISIRAENTKSAKVRHLPLNDEAMQALKRWRSKRKEVHDLIFTNDHGVKFDNVNTAWERLLKNARICDFRWHDMRHHFASRLVQSGSDLNVVRELLGHSNPKMTLIYAHLAPSTKLNAVLKLDQARRNESEVPGVA